MRWLDLRNVAHFESKDLLADGTQGYLFLAQNLPGFFVADLSLAKSLDHAPNLRAVFVGQLMKSVWRTRNVLIRLHWRDAWMVILVIIGRNFEFETADCEDFQT